MVLRGFKMWNFPPEFWKLGRNVYLDDVVKMSVKKCLTGPEI